MEIPLERTKPVPPFQPFQNIIRRSPNSSFDLNICRLRLETCKKYLGMHSRPENLTDSSRDSVPNVSTRTDRTGDCGSKLTDSTESGIACKPVQFGGKSNNRRRWDGDANVKFESAVHPSKQGKSIRSTDDGITSDWREEHWVNALVSIETRFESIAKLTTDSFVQSEKHDWLIRSTDDGIVIDSSPEQFEKTSCSIRRNFDSEAKETDRRAVQLLKQPLFNEITEDGMLIDVRCEHESNARSSIERR